MEKKLKNRHIVELFLILATVTLTACTSTSGQEPSISNIKAAESSAMAPTAVITKPEPTTTDDVKQSADQPEENVDHEATTVGQQGGAAQKVTPVVPTIEPTAEASPTASSQPPTAIPELLSEDGVFLQDDRPDHLRQVTLGWNTNWTKHTVDYTELLSGGPPRDGIPALNDPQFVTIEEAGVWLAGNEPVTVLEIAGDARAYPLQILTWHEIVNDTVGEVAVVITFCPLCNSALTFNRQVGDETVEFGTSGLLRNSDLVMYDRTSESLWQQFTGEAIVGDQVGKQLTFIPSALVSFADFREAYPGAVVLSQNTGHDRPYGINPYAGYDTYDSPLSQGGNIALLKQEQDRRLPAAERVVTVSLPADELDVAYPLTLLSEKTVINDRQGNQDIVVFFSPGTSSALGAEMIAIGEDVGATGVFDPNLDGQKLTFSLIEDAIVDDQTASTWNIFGQSTEGALSGKVLDPIVHGDHFWFSWAAFKPETVIYE